jgi:CTP:molybdopterin cytidylyltransferase MocA
VGGGVALSRVAGLLLAAGRGHRVGGPKALLRLGGTLLVERALDTLREAGCAPLVVVLGAAADQVRAQARLDETTVVENRAWGTGVGSSLRKGLEAVATTDAEAVIVIPVDMPGLTAEAMWRVAERPHRDMLVCATYGRRRDYPMLFGRDHWAGVSTLAHADVDARPYLLARGAQLEEVRCDDIATGTDVDTPETAESLGIPLPGPLLGPLLARPCSREPEAPGLAVEHDADAGRHHDDP